METPNIGSAFGPENQPRILIALIGEQIARRMRQVRQEMECPTRDADASDTLIKEGRIEINQLRMIRQELEGILYGRAE